MSAKRRTRIYDEQTRLRALELAEELGPMQAARELDIPAATLKSWRQQRGLAGPPSGADPESWAEKKREGAGETWATARAALERVKVLIEEGDERKAKDAALTMAILLDKSAALEQASALAEERQAKLAEAQAGAIADALAAVLDDLGIPRSDAIRDLIAHRLRPLSDPDAPTDEPPGKEEAQAALRAHLRAEWDRELPRIEPIAALPPGEPDAEPEDAPDPVPGSKVSVQRRPRPAETVVVQGGRR